MPAVFLFSFTKYCQLKWFLSSVVRLLSAIDVIHVLIDFCRLLFLLSDPQLLLMTGLLGVTF